MIRVVIFLAAVAILAFGATWIADRPGEVAITWLGYRIETSILVAISAVVALLAATLLIWTVARALLRAPRALVDRRRQRRAARGRSAITRGLVAIGSGDVRAARRLAAEARRFAADEPLTLLLTAQTAQLGGDAGSAEGTFRRMIGRSDTRLLGLHGLFVEAQRRGDMAAARSLAEDAAKADPSLAWAAQAVLEFRCAERDWTGALAALDSNVKAGLLDKPGHKRLRAVLLTAKALTRGDGEVDRDAAKAAVVEAVKLRPDLVPAAALAARLMAEDGETRKAARIIEAAWRVNPHPDLAETYAYLKSGDSARDRLARVETLARMLPNEAEGAQAVARAAIDAREFAIARAALAPLLPQPTRRVALLMAQIEEADTGDIGRAREWMSRALNAGRDPAWTADGLVSPKWMPVSPVTGRLDAFQWRVPLADLTPPGPVIESHHRPAGPAAQLPHVVQEPAVPAPAPATPEAAAPASVEAPAAPPPPAPPPSPASAPAPVHDPIPAPAPSAPEAAAEPAPESLPAAKPEKPGEERTEAIIPPVHAPDDPGPEPYAELEPKPAPKPRTEGWRRLRTLFR